MLTLDLWTYWWHRANHRIPFLWRFHRMHHSDPAMDVTTATRFHLGEITVSTIVRLGIIPLVGIPLRVIVVYELVLLVSTQFHHSNIALPSGIDRILRLVIVSPEHALGASLKQASGDGFELLQRSLHLGQAFPKSSRATGLSGDLPRGAGSG